MRSHRTPSMNVDTSEGRGTVDELLTVSGKASSKVMRTTVVLCRVKSDSACTDLTASDAL